MQNELQALLRLQAEDDVVDRLASAAAAIAPRLTALDAERARVARQLEQALGQLQTAERKQREVAQRVAEHRQRQDRNVAQLDLVKRLREAEAAQSQVEAGKRLLQEGEADLRAASDAVDAMRQAAEAHRSSLAAFDASLETRRGELVEESRTLDGELAAARAQRDAAAVAVPAGMRAQYDRIRSRRRQQVVFPVTSGACGACDTAVPVQRRTQMQAKGSIEPCEGCGMLLYATE